MKLNNIQIKNAKAKEKPYRLSDGENLYLEVNPNGKKYWRMAYRFIGKRKQVGFGKYPIITLQEAREKRLETQRLIANGIDPVAAKRQQQLEHQMQHDNNFEEIAKEWHQQKQHTWQPRHAERILKRLSTHLFPVFGHKPISDIKAPELLHALRPIEQSGKHELAHRILQTTGQIFRYAVACGKAERDITQDLRGALKPTVSGHFTCLEEKALPAFLKSLNRYDLPKEDDGCNGNPLTKWGFQLLILTFVRTGELLGAKWDEIDFDKKLWRIPKERMKMKEQHLVPLSSPALLLLDNVHQITGNSCRNYVLPSFHDPRKTISGNTFLKAISNMGYKGQTTGHGFSSTASTILNENGFRADIIERQLAHAERNQIRAAYNHAEYLSERTEMMQWWAKHLVQHGMVIDKIEL